MKETLLYNDIWFDVEYDYDPGSDGSEFSPPCPESVKLWSMCIDNKDIFGMLSRSTIDEVENKILEEFYGV